MEGEIVVELPSAPFMSVEVNLNLFGKQLIAVMHWMERETARMQTGDAILDFLQEKITEEKENASRKSGSDGQPDDTR